MKRIQAFTESITDLGDMVENWVGLDNTYLEDIIQKDWPDFVPNHRFTKGQLMNILINLNLSKMRNCEDFPTTSKDALELAGWIETDEARGLNMRDLPAEKSFRSNAIRVASRLAEP
jgi:hypothetical protein